MKLDFLKVSDLFTDREPDCGDEEMAGLIESIKERGVLIPLMVIPRDGKYKVIDGVSRLFAAKAAKLKKVPCEIRELSDIEIAEIKIIASVKRIKTSPVDYAKALQRLMSSNPDMTVEILAARIDRSVEWINNQLTLNELSNRAKILVHNERICVTNALELAKLSKAKQNELLDPAEQMATTTFKKLVRDI